MSSPLYKTCSLTAMKEASQLQYSHHGAHEIIIIAVVIVLNNINFILLKVCYTGVIVLYGHDASTHFFFYKGLLFFIIDYA